MLKATRTQRLCHAEVSAAGTVSNGEGLVNGATGVGSCTLSDTSLYTFDITGLFKEVPRVYASAVNTTDEVRMHVISRSITSIVIRGTNTDTNAKTASAFYVDMVGKNKGLQG